MARRLAAASALIVFAACLVAGVRAGNSFSTTVGRAVLAMLVTLVIGLIAGAMMERTMEEGLDRPDGKTRETGTDSGAGGR